MPLSREKRPISRPLGHKLKNKDTLLFQTLKVEEKKVSLVFLFKAQEPRYDHLYFEDLGARFKLSSVEEISYQTKQL